MTAPPTARQRETDRRTFTLLRGVTWSIAALGIVLLRAKDGLVQFALGTAPLLAMLAMEVTLSRNGSAYQRIERWTKLWVSMVIAELLVIQVGILAGMEQGVIDAGIPISRLVLVLGMAMAFAQEWARWRRPR